MNQKMAQLKTFNTEQLLHLLQNCAHDLAFAYQAMPEHSLFLTYLEAKRACEFLSYALRKQSITQSIH